MHHSGVHPSFSEYRRQRVDGPEHNFHLRPLSHVVGSYIAIGGLAGIDEYSPPAWSVYEGGGCPEQIRIIKPVLEFRVLHIQALLELAGSLFRTAYVLGQLLIADAVNYAQVDLLTYLPLLLGYLTLGFMKNNPGGLRMRVTALKYFQLPFILGQSS